MPVLALYMFDEDLIENAGAIAIRKLKKNTFFCSQGEVTIKQKYCLSKTRFDAYLYFL